MRQIVSLPVMPPMPRKPKESAREYAIRALKHNIVTLNFAPGTSVSAAELAEMLGVSRTPIREAMQELDKIGLLKVYPQAGSRISHIDLSAITELHFIRLALEQAVVDRACDCIGPQEYLKFEEMLQMQKYHLKSGQKELLLEQDNLFHRYLYEMTDRMVAYDIMADYQCHFDRVRRLNLDSWADQRLINEHRGLFEAIKRGDKPAAKNAVAAHLSRHFADERQVSNHPEYFIN